jgi:hypothetical protein
VAGPLSTVAGVVAPLAKIASPMSESATYVRLAVSTSTPCGELSCDWGPEIVDWGATSPNGAALANLRTDLPKKLATSRFPALSWPKPSGTSSSVDGPPIVASGLASPLAFEAYSVSVFAP